MQALLRAPYINERAGGGRSRIRQCLVSVNPSEPALLHRWTSLKVKTFPHQGFVKENGCIFLEAIIFILLSVLESNPRKPSAPGLTGLPACCCRAAMGPGRSAGSGLPPAALLSPPCTQGCRKHPYHWRSKDRAKPRRAQCRVPIPPCQHKHACQCCCGCCRSPYKGALIQPWSMVACTKVSFL